MADVDRLFSEYVAEHRAGGPADPFDYLARVEAPGPRRELEALIDGYLARAPRRSWDPAAFAGSRAEQLSEELDRSLHGTSGTWPTLLPALRHAAQLRRAEVVSRLAAALGVSSREEKVAGYYHEMEQGRLPARGVSARVLEALGSILATSADALRAAGEGTVPPSAGGGPGPVFARQAAPDAAFSPPPPAAAAAPASPAPSEEPPERDEVDRLFLDG
jgi:hypothetical protein